MYSVDHFYFLEQDISVHLLNGNCLSCFETKKSLDYTSHLFHFCYFRVEVAVLCCYMVQRTSPFNL